MDPAELAHLRDGIKAIADIAATMNTSSLAIFGGTIIGIVGSKFLRPSGGIRYCYLLFLPAWFCLGGSVYYGDKIARRLVAAAFAGDEQTVHDIAAAMNSNFDVQRQFLLWALLFFVVWMVILLMWWIYTEERLRKTDD